MPKPDGELVKDLRPTCLLVLGDGEHVTLGKVIEIKREPIDCSVEDVRKWALEGGEGDLPWRTLKPGKTIEVVVEVDAK